MIAFKKVKKEQFAKDGGDANLFDEICLPRRATSASAGYDIFAPSEIVVEKGQTALIATGIKAQMPQNAVLLILPRSGLGFKYKLRLCNTVGVIDADYFDNAKNEGHIMIKLSAEGERVVIEKGKAFAQGIFVNYLLCDDDDVNDSRKGGFGSTDKK